MSSNLLFPQDHCIGRFKGFVGCHGSLEFHADLVLPYHRHFQRLPMHGQYLLVELEAPDEAILGRIVSLVSDHSSQAQKRRNEMPYEKEVVSELDREKALIYRVNMHVLGVLSKKPNHALTFVASHRRLPPAGSRVAFPPANVLQEIAGHNSNGVPIGHLAFGEYIYAYGSTLMQKEEWMHILKPEICIRFPIENLIARRSFIFARAGFGKSNLNKLLFSELYKQIPIVTKRGGRQVPVGTLLFDPDGEYFWPDDKGRPGLCDVPSLQDKLVIFTEREAPSPFYQSFVAGGIKVDIRELSANEVVSQALCTQKQEQQNVQKLKALNELSWRKLVNLIEKKGNQAKLPTIGKLLGIKKKQQIEAIAARSNMVHIVHILHDRQSKLLHQLKEALAQGSLCVLDVSHLHDTESLIFSGLLLRYLFQHNQQEFTREPSHSIPIIAVIEEAQSVLTENTSAAEPHRAWVKEGRKYDLGALLITQQPGSLPPEILSQGDNWFVLHLLSATDLKTLQKANAYFSRDILCMLLNEPLPGHAILWSSVSGKSYPVSLRALSFEHVYTRLDPAYNRMAVATRAVSLRAVEKQVDSEEDELEESDKWEEEDELEKSDAEK